MKSQLFILALVLTATAASINLQAKKLQNLQVELQEASDEIKHLAQEIKLANIGQLFDGLAELALSKTQEGSEAPLSERLRNLLANRKSDFLQTDHDFQFVFILGAQQMYDRTFGLVDDELKSSFLIKSIRSGELTEEIKNVSSVLDEMLRDFELLTGQVARIFPQGLEKLDQFLDLKLSQELGNESLPEASDEIKSLVSDLKKQAQQGAQNLTSSYAQVMEYWQNLEKKAKAVSERIDELCDDAKNLDYLLNETSGAAQNMHAIESGKEAYPKFLEHVNRAANETLSAIRVARDWANVNAFRFVQEQLQKTTQVVQAHRNEVNQGAVRYLGLLEKFVRNAQLAVNSIDRQ